MASLSELAKARTGDKGDDSIVGVYCENREDWIEAKRLLDAQAISAHFGLDPTSVSITELPELLAFTVVLRGVLAGGVTRSLRSDPHGKTLGSYLLEL